MNPKQFIVPPGQRGSLQKNYNPAFKDGFGRKRDAKARLRYDVDRLSAYLDLLHADHTYALLIIFQAMDAAGKDSTIKHVMTGVNPQWCQVTSFRTPSTKELAHDYLWRYSKALPKRGYIGIFNRSYYEEVLVVRVHSEFLEAQRLPATIDPTTIWRDRFEDINNFERYLVRNGIIILKFFLNVSWEKQRQRFLKRIDNPAKNWKFSPADVQERHYWNEYAAAYDDLFFQTSTSWAPWYIIPADHKWYAHVAVADIIVTRLAKLDLHFPTVGEKSRKLLAHIKQRLERETR